MTASKDASKVPAPTKAKSKKTEKSEEEALLDGLMSEIEEDLRDEEIAKIWKQYGNLIIAVIVVGIVSVIGWQLWKQNQDAKQAELTRQYEVASNLVRDGKFDEAMTAYAAVADKHSGGLAALSQLQKAALAIEKGDSAGALATYKALENDASADALFRDLAAVFYTLHAIDTENALQLEANLKPLLDPANPLRHSALELTALLAGKQGDVARGLKIAEELSADPKAPQGVRQRAEELAAMYRLAPVTAASATSAPSQPAPKTEAAPKKP